MGPIINGQASELFAELEPRSVQLIWTDPPFGTDTTQSLKHAYRDGTVEDTVRFMRALGVEAERVLTDDGVLALCLDYRAIHQAVVAIQESGLTFHGEIIWSFAQGRAATKWWANKHNTVALFDRNYGGRFHTDKVPTVNRAAGPTTRKYKDKVYEYGETRPVNSVWDITGMSKAERSGYPNQKPRALIEPFVDVHTDEGDLVVDPFMGSGSTAVSALGKGRRFAGSDINPEAVEITLARIKL